MEIELIKIQKILFELKKHFLENDNIYPTTNNNVNLYNNINNIRQLFKDYLNEETGIVDVKRIKEDNNILLLNQYELLNNFGFDFINFDYKLQSVKNNIEKLKEHFLENYNIYPNQKNNVNLYVNINNIRQLFKDYLNEKTGIVDIKRIKEDNNILLLKQYELLNDFSFDFINFDSKLQPIRNNIKKLKEHLTENNNIYPTKNNNVNLYISIKYIRQSFKDYLNEENGIVDIKKIKEDNNIILLKQYELLNDFGFDFINFDSKLQPVRNNIKKLKEHLTENNNIYPTFNNNVNLYNNINKIRLLFKDYLNEETGIVDVKRIKEDNNIILLKQYELLNDFGFDFINFDSKLQPIKNNIEKLKEYLRENNNIYPTQYNNVNLYNNIYKIRLLFKDYLNEKTGIVDVKKIKEDNNIILLKQYELLNDFGFDFINFDSKLQHIKNNIEKLKEHLTENNNVYPTTNNNLNLYNNIKDIRLLFKDYLNEETGIVDVKRIKKDNIILFKQYELLNDFGFDFINFDSKLQHIKNNIEKLKEYLTENNNIYPTLNNNVNLYNNINNIRQLFKDYLNEKNGIVDVKKIKEDNIILFKQYELLNDFGFDFINFDSKLQIVRNVIEKLKEYLTENNNIYPTQYNNNNLYNNIYKIRQLFKDYLNEKNGIVDVKRIKEDNNIILLKQYELLNDFGFDFINFYSKIQPIKNIIEKLKEHLTENNNIYPTYNNNVNLYNNIKDIRQSFKDYLNEETGIIVDVKRIKEDNNIILLKQYELLNDFEFDFINFDSKLQHIKNIIEKLKEHLTENNNIYPTKNNNVNLYVSIKYIRQLFKDYLNEETGIVNIKRIKEDNNILLLKQYELLNDFGFQFIGNSIFNSFKIELNKYISEVYGFEKDKFREENLNLFVPYFINKRTNTIDYNKLLKQGGKLLNFKFQELLKIDFFDKSILPKELLEKDSKKNNLKEYKIAEDLVFDIIKDILSNEKNTKNIDIQNYIKSLNNNDLDNKEFLENFVYEYIENDLNNENSIFTDIYRIDNKKQDIIYKDVISILKLGVDKYNSLNFSIIDCNKIKHHNKGYDYMLQQGKGNKINNEKETINISYKFIEGRSFGSSKFEEVFLVDYTTMMKHTNNTKRLSIEIDSYIKEKSNIEDILIERFTQFISLPNIKELKTEFQGSNIENIIKNNLNLVTSYNLNINNSIQTYSIVDKEDNIEKFNDTLNKYITNIIKWIINDKTIGEVGIEKVIRNFKQKLSLNGFMRDIYLTDEGIRISKYIVKEIHRNKHLRKESIEKFGIPYTTLFSKTLLADIKYLCFDKIENMTDIEKIKWFEDNLHLRDGKSVIIENGEVIELLDRNMITKNIKDIKISIGNIKNNETGFKFDIIVKLNDDILFKLNENKLKSKQGMLIGTLRTDLGQTKDLSINNDLLHNEITLNKRISNKLTI